MPVLKRSNFPTGITGKFQAFWNSRAVLRVIFVMSSVLDFCPQYRDSRTLAAVAHGCARKIAVGFALVMLLPTTAALGGVRESPFPNAPFAEEALFFDESVKAPLTWSLSEPLGFTVMSPLSDVFVLQLFANVAPTSDIASVASFVAQPTFAWETSISLAWHVNSQWDASIGASWRSLDSSVFDAGFLEGAPVREADLSVGASTDGASEGVLWLRIGADF